MNTNEIELLLKKYTTPIHDDMGFTGCYKANVRDIVDVLLNERDIVLSLLSVSKSLKVEMQYFDSCDCPYQINTFIKKHNIDVNNIISFSENEDSVTMYYKTF